jgi:hypothetical protein
MTVISRLFRQAPIAPQSHDQQLAGLQSQSPQLAAGGALGGEDEAARSAAISTLGAGDALYALAGLIGSDSTAPDIQRAAQQRVASLIDLGTISFAQLCDCSTNTSALLSVAGCSADASLLPQRIEAIADEQLLGNLAIAGASPAIRQLAAARVQDSALLQRLLKNARGKDKNVYRILKQKRDAINAQERAVSAALEAVSTLCATIEHHIHQPFNSSYAPIVEHLVAQWHAVAASAPAELRARAEAAIDRCRMVVTRHEQQIANHAAHAAAIEHAVPERQAILQALQALLSAVYAASASDVTAQLAAHAARWIELAGLRAPARDEIATFEQLSNAIALLDVFNARHGSVQIQAAALDAGNVAALRRALSHVSLLGEQLPGEARDALAALQAREQARAAEQAAAAAALRQVSGLVRRAQSTLAAGHSRQAAGMRRAVEDKLHKLSAVPPQLSTQLQAFDQQLGVLQDWRSFAVAPKRAELIAQMEALIDSGAAPTALAVQIKRLQDEWKLISKGSTEDTQAEWQRFHDAAQKAYEPCREFFAAQAMQRAHNLERRGALLERLQAFATAQNWEQADWREVARAVRESWQQWRSLQPVERAANRPLQASFDALLADLQSRLNAEYTRNAEAKRALIGRALRLVGLDDSRQAVDEVKRLQLAWQSVGLVAHEDSQRLWEEFRQHCDAVFARRQQQQTEYVASLEANQGKAVELCVAAEQLLALSGPELIEEAKKLPALREAFETIDDLPRDRARGLRGRFETALDQCQKQLAQLRASEKSQAWEHVLNAADRIRLYRLAIVAGATPEECAARQADAQVYIDGVSQWPKGALQALRAALAQPGSPDIAANEAALRTLCIRAELLTDTPTPAGDTAFRRDYQLQQLLKGLGQARAASNQDLEAMVFEWLAVGATSDALYAQLLERFRNCRSRQRAD